MMKLGVLTFFPSYLYEYPPNDPMTWWHHNDIMNAKVNTTAHWSYSSSLEHNRELGNVLTKH